MVASILEAGEGRLWLHDNGGLHKWVNLAMVGECAWLHKSMAIRSTGRRDGIGDA